MGQVVVGLGNVSFQPGDGFVCLVLVEFQNARHLDIHQLEDVFLRHFADELRIKRSQALVDVLACRIHRLGLLELFVLVDAFFDEYLL